MSLKTPSTQRETAFRKSPGAVKTNWKCKLNDLRLRSHWWIDHLCRCVYARLTDRYSEYLTAYYIRDIRPKNIAREARRKEQQITYRPVHLHWYFNWNLYIEYGVGCKFGGECFFFLNKFYTNFRNDISFWPI